MNRRFFLPIRRKIAICLMILFSVLCSCSSSENAPSGTDQKEPSGDGTVNNEFLGTGSYEGAYFPTEAWKRCSPEEVDVDPQDLLKVYDYAANPLTKTQGILIIKDGYIIGEAYFDEFESTTRHESWSMAKSFTSAVVGIAIDQGYINSIDDKVCEHVDEWDCDDTNDPRRNITIKHLLTLTSGLDWNEDWTNPSLVGNDAMEMLASDDWVALVTERECLNDPGTVFNYSTGDPTIISLIIEKATGMSPYEFAMENIFERIGIPDIEWNNDPAGNTTTAVGIQATLREYAKFGYLYLNKGKWENEQVVPEDWVTLSTSTGGNIVPWYGFLWHVCLPIRLNAIQSGIPFDAYMAEGLYGQKIYIIPSKGLVIVRVAVDSETSHLNAAWNDVSFLTLILDSLL